MQLAFSSLYIPMMERPVTNLWVLDTVLGLIGEAKGVMRQV